MPLIGQTPGGFLAANHPLAHVQQMGGALPAAASGAGHHGGNILTTDHCII